MTFQCWEYVDNQAPKKSSVITSSKESKWIVTGRVKCKPTGHTDSAQARPDNAKTGENAESGEGKKKTLQDYTGWEKEKRLEAFRNVFIQHLYASRVASRAGNAGNVQTHKAGGVKTETVTQHTSQAQRDGPALCVRPLYTLNAHTLEFFIWTHQSYY